MITLSCDVGTSSVRVAIFEYLNESTLNTSPLAVATRPLTIYNRKSDFYEQKSSEIWDLFCQCAEECLTESGLKEVKNEKCSIDAVAFSATCSLVIVEDVGDEPDVIMWLDHRAKQEAELITATRHNVLKQFGGVCSPEFSLSKLVWLFRNQRKRFDSAKAFMELPDWLTYRCSKYFGTPEAFPRSLCCVTCKWGYDSVNNNWPSDLFETLGMDFNSLLKQRIGSMVLKPGLKVSSLRTSVAKELGLKHLETDSKEIDSVSLSSSLIDAHAGVISMLTFSNQDSFRANYENAFCMISGTSTCHMILNKAYSFTNGVWGPYFEAIIPGYYLREAGQSATGKLIDHVIQTYYKNQLPTSINEIIHQLNDILVKQDYSHQTKLVVNPTFHGNRSPIGNPNLKGAIYGYTFDETTLLDYYVATVEAIAYETKFILEEVEKTSVDPFNRIIVSGGLTKNDFYLQQHADILNLELVVFNSGELNLMLAGASVIAFTASKVSSNQEELISVLNSIDINSNSNPKVFKPRPQFASYHEKKYKCYRHLLDCCLKMDIILSNEN